MKKFILGLFLILGAMSFAVPNYVNTTKIKSAGYEITTDDKDIFGLGKVTQEAAISVAIYPFGNNTPQSIADAMKASKPANVQFLAPVANNRAFVNKYKDGEIYVYNFVPKKQKSKACHISVLYMTEKNLSGAALNKAVDSTLNEVENFLK